jgi:hypothetical protein
MLFAMTSRRRARWLLAASLGVVAGIVGGFAHDEGSTVAQPGWGNSCMSIGNIFGIPGLGDNEANMGNIAIGNGGNTVQTNIGGSGSCCNINIGNRGDVVQNNIGGAGECAP